MNEWLLEKLNVLGTKTTPTYILFDELDLGYDPNDPAYTDRVVGLLVAVRAFVTNLTRKGVPIHPIAFLRSDIFDELKFGDKNKVLEANAVESKWNDDLAFRGASLSHLLNWRIKEELDVPHIEDAWSLAFDERVTRGTQHKFHHMTYRTFLRPRDLIKFANLALLAAQERFEAHGGDRRISNDDLKAARIPYSSYFRKELDDEIAEADKQWQAQLEVLRSIGAARFSKADFLKGYTSAKRKTHIDRSADECLAFFYKYSIVGFARSVTSAGWIDQFHYQDESVIFEPEAPSFLVHRGLKEALGLTETITDVRT